MDEKEIKSLIEQLKAQGLEDEEIMKVFYKTFEDGEMDRKDLEILADAMGYELTDDFKNDATPDPIEGGEGEEGLEDLSKEELEDAEQLEPGETKEEFADRIGIDGEDEGEGEDADVEEDEEAEDEPAEDEGEENEDEEWEKAQKMFKI